MPKSDSSEYEGPRAVRLSDAANGRGDSCDHGASDVSCRTGNTAHPACYPGNDAHGCLTGAGPQMTSCQTGSSPKGGCFDGNGVFKLQ